MQHVAIEPRLVELVRIEVGCPAPVGGHRAVVGRRDRDDDAVPARHGARDLDAERAQFARDQLAGSVVAAAADEARVGAELLRPRGDVRRLAAGARPDRRGSVVALHERSLERDDHVEKEIADGGQAHAYDGRMERTRHGGRLRSFAIGGVVGAAGAIATARRVASRSRRPRGVPSGLVAFEDAPCFLETVGDEPQRNRDNAERRS